MGGGKNGARPTRNQATYFHPCRQEGLGCLFAALPQSHSGIFLVLWNPPNGWKIEKLSRGSGNEPVPFGPEFGSEKRNQKGPKNCRGARGTNCHCHLAYFFNKNQYIHKKCRGARGTRLAEMHMQLRSVLGAEWAQNAIVGAPKTSSSKVENQADPLPAQTRWWGPNLAWSASVKK